MPWAEGGTAHQQRRRDQCTSRRPVPAPHPGTHPPRQWPSNDLEGTPQMGHKSWCADPVHRTRIAFDCTRRSAIGRPRLSPSWIGRSAPQSGYYAAASQLARSKIMGRVKVMIIIRNRRSGATRGTGADVEADVVRTGRPNESNHRSPRTRDVRCWRGGSACRSASGRTESRARTARRRRRDAPGGRRDSGA